jgi:hypothetical protein
MYLEGVGMNVHEVHCSEVPEVKTMNKRDDEGQNG